MGRYVQVVGAACYWGRPTYCGLHAGSSRPQRGCGTRIRTSVNERRPGGNRGWACARDKGCCGTGIRSARIDRNVAGCSIGANGCDPADSARRAGASQHIGYGTGGARARGGKARHGTGADRTGHHCGATDDGIGTCSHHKRATGSTSATRHGCGAGSYRCTGDSFKGRRKARIDRTAGNADIGGDRGCADNGFIG